MYVQIGSSVITYLCSRARNQLAAANRLQKYKNFPTYTNFYEEKFIFCPFKAKKQPLHHTFFGMYRFAGAKV